jgi:hypothetical protein
LTANPSRPIPKANTGSALQNAVANFAIRLVQIERRIDPLFRPAFDAALRDPLAKAVTWLINRKRVDEGLGLAEESLLPDEETYFDSIISSFEKQLHGLWKRGAYERGGNTKTHGIVRGEFTVHDNLPPELRHGVFARPQTYKAWVRFSGPGPYITPDIDDVGFMSISVKLMGVPGTKLMEDEKFTQDLLAVSVPVFVSPDATANAQLQIESMKNAQIFYFLNFHRPHILDFIMQGLFLKTQGSLLEEPYFSQVPYLMGEGQAMQYSFRPVRETRTKVPGLPSRPPDDYLRQRLAVDLSQGDAVFDVCVQMQTDSFLMPLENSAVLWPDSSPRRSVATLRLSKQSFMSEAQFDFARRLSYNPWHCLPEHRPLGNINRARKRVYDTLSRFRHGANGVLMYEPTGDEVFD